jgi:hypothetical protein
MATETRNIILKSRDILASNDANDYFNTTVSNSKGIVENNRLTYTWNINLRETFGDDFYNKYSRFSIRMKSYQDNPLSTTVVDPSNVSMQYWSRTKNFYLSGLNYDPMPYMNGALSNGALLQQSRVMGYPLTPGLSNGSIHNTDNVISPVYYFTKPTQDTVSLQMNIKNQFDDQLYQPPTSAQIYGHLIITLSVVGIV